MRIGVLSQWYPPEPGAASVPGVLARALAGRGHDVQVVTGFPNYPTGAVACGYRMRRRADETDGAGVSIRRVALYPSHDRSTARRSANYLSFALSASCSGISALRSADAVWVYNSPATIGLPSLLASAAGGPPHLMHVMDVWPDSILFSGLVTGRRYRAMAKPLAAWVGATYRWAAAIACITPGIADALHRRGVPRAKLSHIPVWTDEAIYRVRTPDRELAAELGVAGRFVVLYAGNLGRAQGLDHLLDVCRRVEDLDGLHVLVAGSGTAEHALRSRAEDLGLANLRFLGRWPPEDMGRLLSISDLNLVSLTDDPLAQITLPSKLPGILASGRAVLAWAGGEVARIVTDSGAGLVAAPGDAEALEQALRDAYGSGKDAMARLGAQGASYYGRHLSLQRGVDQVERLLATIAGATHTEGFAPLTGSAAR